MAAATADGTTRGLVRACRSGLALRILVRRLGQHVVGYRSALLEPTGGSPRDNRRPTGRRSGPVDAAAGPQLRLGGRNDLRVAGNPRRPPSALVVDPFDLGLGHGAWHVAARHHYRPCRT